MFSIGPTEHGHRLIHLDSQKRKCISNRAFKSLNATEPVCTQIRTRPVPMTEEEVSTMRKETGRDTYFKKKYVPVAHGRPRSQTRRKKV